MAGVSIRVVGIRGASRLLGRISLSIVGTPKSLSSGAVSEIRRLVALHDQKGWVQMQARERIQHPVSLAAGLFSREKDFVRGTKNSTIEDLRLRAVSKKPLEDRGLLKDAVTNPVSRFTKALLTHTSITFRILLDYARKHMKPARNRTQVGFEFGDLERRRLEERVPKPGKGRRNIIFGREITLTEGGPGEDRFVARAEGTRELVELRTRAFYRLRNWAERRYPTFSNVVGRTWVTALGPSTRQKITDIMALDIARRANPSG